MRHPTTRLRGAAGAPPAVEQPVLQVVRGDATPEEVAALVAVLAARAGAPAEDDATPARSAWAQPQVRRPLPQPGPGAWRAAARDARTRAAW